MMVRAAFMAARTVLLETQKTLETKKEKKVSNFYIFRQLSGVKSC